MLRTMFFVLAAVVVGLGSLFADEADAELFAPPVGWYDSAPRSDVVQVITQVRQLLKEDWAGKAATEKVVVRYVTANKLCPTDGRLPFAWGLYFWKAQDPVRALSAFEKSAVISPRFLPGHQAAAWVSLKTSDPDRGLAKLEGLLSALLEPEETYTSQKQKFEAAEWLGRAIGFLEGPAAKAASAERLAEFERKLTELSADRRAAFDRGRQAVAKRAEELQATSAQTPDQVQADFRLQLSDTQQRLAECRKRISELQTELKGNADEISAALREQRRDIGTAQQLKQQICFHQQEASRLERASYGRTISERVPEYKRKKQKDGSYEREQVGYKTVKTKLPETAAETARRMEDIQRNRAAASEKSKAAGDLQAQLKAQRDETTALTKDSSKFRNTIAAEWTALHATQRELTLKQAKIENWLADSEQFAAYVRTLEPYLPWDVEAQREQLLDAFEYTK